MIRPGATDVEGTCTCRDYEQAPAHLCQHRLSAGLVRRIQALVPPSAAVEPVAAQEPGPQALPEAPASVNCHILLAGRQVQLTLRDMDETRLLARLEAVLALYPLPQPASQAPTQGQGAGQGWCAVHNTAMQENHKDGRTWYSHRTDQGWCKGHRGRS